MNRIRVGGGSLGARFVTSSGSRSRPLRVLYEDEAGLAIVMFHEGAFRQVESLMQNGLLTEQTHLIFTFSWHQSLNQLAGLHDRLAAAANRAGISMDAVRSRVSLLVNSRKELDDARRAFEGFNALLVNNAVFLNTELFAVGTESRLYDAVLNSKYLAFKRHSLSRQVNNKVFITYDTNEADAGRTAKVNIEDFAPLAIFRNLPVTEVVKVLQQSRVGLLLSEAEGACYASLEYLLCGLPVVSTPSLGGRAEFYDGNNSMIVEPNEVAVREGVQQCLARLASGAWQPDEIRADALRKITEFRARFAGEITRILRQNGREPFDVAGWLDRLFREDNKLGEHRNFWVQEVLRAS